MSERKPSARRPSRDDDDAPAPKKKDSGIQKPLKKKTSARKAAEEDDDEADAKPKSKRASARGSARSAAGGSARQAGGGPDKGKVFLYFVPGVMLILLGIGYYVATLPEPKGPSVIKVDYNTDIAKARGMYNQAKAAYEAGNKIEGAGGIPKLEECKHLCTDAMAMIDSVREKVGEAEQKDGKPMENYEFESLATSLGQLFKMVKSAIQERK